MALPHFSIIFPISFTNIEKNCSVIYQKDSGEKAHRLICDTSILKLLNWEISYLCSLANRLKKL